MYNPGPEFRITSGYGWRKHPVTGETKFHRGIDYAAPKGTDVPAAYKGKVYFTGYISGYGNTVVIKSSTNDGKIFYTLYAHLDSINVNVGVYINTGDIIGKVGNTGVSTGPHLHFEAITDNNPLKRGKKTVDPKTFDWADFYNYNNNSSPSNPFPNPYTHTVQSGDTLSKIAEKYGVSVEDLLKANPWIKNPDYIQVGWKIKIPGPGYAEKVRRNLREGTRRIDPLVIDLDGDGIELTDIKESKAMFDLIGSGFANKVGWIYNFA